MNLKLNKSSTVVRIIIKIFKNPWFCSILMLLFSFLGKVPLWWMRLDFSHASPSEYGRSRFRRFFSIYERENVSIRYPKMDTEKGCAHMALIASFTADQDGRRADWQMYAAAMFANFNRAMESGLVFCQTRKPPCLSCAAIRTTTVLLGADDNGSSVDLRGR